MRTVAWGEGKTQVRANWGEISVALSQGINCRLIYDELKSRGKFSASLETFRRIVWEFKKQGFSAPEASAPAQVNSGARALPSAVIQPVSQSRPFGGVSHKRPQPQTNNNIPKSQRTFRMSHNSEDVI